MEGNFPAFLLEEAWLFHDSLALIRLCSALFGPSADQDNIVNMNIMSFNENQKKCWLFPAGERHEGETVFRWKGYVWLKGLWFIWPAERWEIPFI